MPANAESTAPAGSAPALDYAMERQVSGAKRKEPEQHKKPSFKVVGTLVLAMKRFSESLNPTYTYGKRTSSTSGSGSKQVPDDVEAVTSGEKRLDRPPSATGRAATPESQSKYAYSNRGHKFDFLVKPLPATEGEEAPHPSAVASPRRS